MVAEPQTADTLIKVARFGTRNQVLEIKFRDDTLFIVVDLVFIASSSVGEARSGAATPGHLLVAVSRFTYGYTIACHIVYVS